MGPVSIGVLTVENPRPPGGRLRRLARWAALVAASAATVVGLAGGAVYFALAPTVPRIHTLDHYRPRIGTRIYAADGQLIGEFAEERRVIVPYERMPIALIQAFIAAEDQRFFDHAGVDFIGMANAVLQWARGTAKLRGASTITQQLAKSFLVEHEGYNKATERSVWRKAREAILARRLESALTKEEILYLYLNQIFLGHKAYGVQAAAEHYFRKNVWEMSLAEMATLAGLPQRPSDYSPYSNPEAAAERRKYVLRRMLDEGFISARAYEQALSEEITVYPRQEHFLEVSPYFTEQVRRAVIDLFGERALLEEGLQVHSTMDLSKQAWAQEGIHRSLQDLDKRQGFRGPLAHLPSEHWTEFIDGYSDQVEVPALPGKRYLGLVTDFDYDQKYAKVQVGPIEGIIPLPAIRWARKPNSEVLFEDAWLERPWSVLKKGDVVQVTSTSVKELVNDRFAYEALDQLPKGVDLPYFTLVQDPIAQAAILSVDARSGYVLAMVGGYDFGDSTLNRAIQACRQPGSAFKPLIYTAAIDKNDFTPSTIIIDSPIVEDDPDNELRWKPYNSGKDFLGDTPIRTCLKNSMNICSIKILKEVGVKNAIAYAHKLGITTPLAQDLSLALGSSCVTLWDLVKVYTVFNRYGQERPLHFLKRVYNRDGGILLDNAAPWDPLDTLGRQLDRAYLQAVTRPRQLVDRQTAYIMDRMLYSVVQEGTGVAAKRLRKPAYGKTGTTNDAFDAWFLGFSEDYVTGVWVGHDRYERPLGVKEYGGVAAMPIWLHYMERALAGKDQRQLPPPEGVVGIEIDPENGLLATPETPNAVIEYYRAGSEPREFSRRHTNLANENIYYDDDLADVGTKKRN